MRRSGPRLSEAEGKELRGFVKRKDIKSVAVKGFGELAGLQGTLHFDDTSYTGTLH